ncbi:MAG: FG-GAP-like repeat-containing protein [Candidatus Krumholzibacteria bacterium]|nr:FG-GAP-like repeat-containing protein [Candidatus Krumholzibacteria bacterium]
MLRNGSLLSLLLLIGITAFAAPVNFSKQVIDSTFPANGRPFDVFVADLNGDDEMDIVMTLIDFITTNERTYWYANDGTEVFTRMVLDSTTTSPGRIDVGDVDGDTDLDVVISANNGVFWFDNDGVGNFTKRNVDPAIGSPRQPIIVDLDEDMDEDVLVLTSNGLFWEENNGSENFTQRTIDASPVSDDAIGFGDFDEDNDIDIIGATFDLSTGGSLLAWYENDGSEIFTRIVFDTVTAGISDLVVEDLDDDNHLDLVLVLEQQNELDWYRNDGHATFSIGILKTDFVQSPRALKIADLDNDSDEDVVVAGGNAAIGEVVHYDNDGSETFAKHNIDNTTGNRQRVFVADIDGDSVDDLFVTSQFPMELVMYTGLGTATGIKHKSGGSLGAVLGQNYPNPFNPSTMIEFELAAPAHVRLDVFTVDGRFTRRLADGIYRDGPHGVSWDGRGTNGQAAASGVYFYRLTVDGIPQTRKMLLLQ